MNLFDVLAVLVLVYTSVLMLVSCPVLSIVHVKEKKMIRDEMIKRNLARKEDLF